MIDFLQAYTLKDEHFNIEQEFLIDGLIPKGLITLFYAQGGTGKSFLALSLANYLATQKGQQVVYIDFDNPIRVLKERGIDSLIANSANISYIQRSAVNMKNVDLIKEIECRAIGQSYKDCLFIIDSIRNITDIHNNNKCGDMMDMFMNIREAGATIILLSHSNKDGRNYEGSANIRNSLDCMYKVNKRPSDKHYLNLLLEVDKERAGVSDFAFSIDTKQLTLQEMDMDIAMMDAHEVEMVEQIKKVLLIRGELNKKALMEAIGKDKRDKTTSDIIDKFSGVFWDAKKISNRYIITLSEKNSTTYTTSTTSHNNGALEGANSRNENSVGTEQCSVPTNKEAVND